MPEVSEKLYSALEVARHNKSNDCWIVLNNKVLDVTSYLDEHPGGNETIMAFAGKDATEAFMAAGHSRGAVHLANKFAIGVLNTSGSSSGENSQESFLDEEKMRKQKIEEMMKQQEGWRGPLLLIALIGAIVSGFIYILYPK